MKLIIFILTLTLTTLGSLQVSAQVIGLKELPTTNFLLNECGQSDTVAIEVFNCCSADTLKNISINDSLPSGLSLVSSLPNTNVTNISTGNPSVPVISLHSLAPNQKDTIYLLVKASCGTKAASSSANFKYYISWTQGPNSYSQDELGRNFYSAIKAPNLQLLRNGQVNYTNTKIGDTLSRSWKLQNSGLGSSIDSVTLTVAYQTGTQFTSLKIDGVSITPIISGNTVTYKIPNTLRNVSLYPQDTIIVEESYTVNSCLDNFSNSQISTSWGCDGNACETKSRIAIARISTAIPHITPKHTYIDGCYGGYDTLRLELVNTGGFTASELEIDIATGYSNHISDRARVGSYLDTSSIMYYTSSGTKTHVSPRQVLSSVYSNSYFPINNHPYRSYVRIPNLEAGDTLYVEALIYRACLDEGSCGIYHSIATNYDITFSKECVDGAKYSLPSRVVANHEGKRGGGEIDGPTDLANGDTATFTFCFTSISANTFSKDNDNGYLRIEYQMPSGLTWTGDLSDLDLSLNTSSMSADSVAVDTANNILNIYYEYTNAIARGARREYCITPKFYLDCGSASGGSSNLSVSTYDNFRPECSTTCEIPYTCPVNFSYNAHCPSPCVRGGFNPKVAFIKRNNIGLPDNDEDGFPDASGSLDYSEIEIDRVVAKDTFTLTYAGTVVRGIQSPDTFKYGYGTTTIPNIGHRVMPHTTSVRIWDASTLSTFTVTDVPMAYTTSGGTRTFSVNYSIDGGGIGYPAGYFFDDGDSLIVLAEFIFNPNAARVSDLVNVVENLYYLSDYAFPTSDTAKYRCDRWNAKLKSTDAYYTVWSPQVDVVDGCDQYRANYRSYLSIGQCCSNYGSSSFFKKEYRSFAITDSLRVFIPAGFDIDSAYAEFYHGSEASFGQTLRRWSLAPHRVSGDTAVYYIGDLYSNASGTVMPSRGGFMQTLFVYYTPSCSAPANIALPRKYDIFLKGINSWEGNDRTTLNYGTGSVKFVSPLLSLTNQGSIVSDGANRVISWDIKLQNDASTAAAEKAWIGFSTTNTQIVIDSVRDVSADTLLDKNGSIFTAGRLDGGGSVQSRTFRAYAVFSSCSPDSIKAYSGWDCNEYPTTLDLNSCHVDSTLLIVNPVTSVLQLDTVKSVNNPVDMCETIEYIMSVSQRDLAASYNNIMTINLPRGLTIVEDSSYVEYMKNSSKTYFNPTTSTPRLYSYDVSSNVPEIGTEGLSPFASAPDNEYRLRILLAIDCDFESGSKIEFTAIGNAPCGATIAPARYISTLLINGAPAVTYQVPEISIQGDTLWGCSDSLTIRAVYNNYDTTASSTGHRFRVTLPQGINYIPSSSAFSRNTFSVTQPTISSYFGQQILTWSSSGSTPARDSSIWTFTVASSSTACGTQEIVADITEDFVATCVTDGAICSSTSIVNSTSGYITIAKGDIVMLASSLGLQQDTFYNALDDSLTVDFQLHNQGQMDAGAMHVEVFQDTDGSGTITAGDVLQIDTILGNISRGTMSNYQFTKKAPSGTLSCEMLIRVVPDCSCTDTIINTPGCNLVKLPVELASFTAVKISEVQVKTQWNTHSEFNTEYFEIERSTDNKSFQTISQKIAAAGNSNELLSYQYADNIADLEASKLYYRLKISDIDGQTSYSKAEVVDNPKVNTRAYPNPAQNKIYINSTAQNAAIEIYDLTGTRVATAALTGGLATVDLAPLRNGVYTLTIQTNGYTLDQKKIVVAR